jgi:hypothetical protein
MTEKITKPTSMPWSVDEGTIPCDLFPQVHVISGDDGSVVALVPAYEDGEGERNAEIIATCSTFGPLMIGAQAEALKAFQEAVEDVLSAFCDQPGRLLEITPELHAKLDTALAKSREIVD